MPTLLNVLTYAIYIYIYVCNAQFECNNNITSWNRQNCQIKKKSLPTQNTFRVYSGIPVMHLIKMQCTL